ncbi:hypothetical protein D3C77_635990 [compost metagenome]
MLHEARGEDAHEAGQHHQIRLVGVDGFDQCGVEGLAARERLVIQHGGGDPGILRAGQPVGICAVGDHRADACRVVFAQAVDQRLQVAAGAGDQHHHIAGLDHQWAFRLFSTTRSAPSAPLAMLPITHGCSPLARRLASTASA